MGREKMLYLAPALLKTKENFSSTKSVVKISLGNKILQHLILLHCQDADTPDLPDPKSLGLSPNTGCQAEVICNVSLRRSREGSMS